MSILYVAFLRGINVGGNRSISMSEQKSCFESMGFSNVKVILQTGNILFNSQLEIPDLTKTIESKLSQQFNYPAKVMVFSVAQLQKIEANYPYQKFNNLANSSNFHEYIIFLSHPLDWPNPIPQCNDELILVQENVVYWKIGKGQTLKSEFSKLLSKAKYKEFNTVRNINTIRRVLSKI